MPLRGGYWAYCSAAGVFALGFCDVRTFGAVAIGFRAALSLCQMLKSYGILSSTKEDKGAGFLAARQKI